MPKVVRVKASKRAKAHTRNVKGKQVKSKDELGNSFMPNSSMIEKVSYNPKVSTLYVKFKNGKTYNYSNVDRSVFNNMRKAKSAGKYFHSEIKSQYSSHKMF